MGYDLGLVGRDLVLLLMMRMRGNLVPFFFSFLFYLPGSFTVFSCVSFWDVAVVGFCCLLLLRDIIPYVVFVFFLAIAKVIGE